MRLLEQSKDGSMNWDNLYNKRQSLVPLVRNNKVNWELLIIKWILAHHCGDRAILNAGANVSLDSDYLLKFGKELDKSVHMCDALHWADEATKQEFITWAEAKFPQATHHWTIAQNLSHDFDFIFNGLSNFSDITDWYLKCPHPCWMLRVTGTAQDMFNQVAQAVCDHRIFYVLRTSGFDLWCNDELLRDAFIESIPQLAAQLETFDAHFAVFRGFVSATSNSGANQQLYSLANHQEYTSYLEIDYKF